MLQHNTQGQDAAEVRRLLEQLEIANGVSRGMLMPAGKTGSLKSVKRLLGFVPGCLKVFAAQGQQRQTLFDADFKARFAGRDSARAFLDGLDVPGVLSGRDPLNNSMFVCAKSFLPIVSTQNFGNPNREAMSRNWSNSGSAAVPEGRQGGLRYPLETAYASVARWGWAKSSVSARLFASLSRSVNGASPKRHSIIFNTDVWSYRFFAT